ncbi:hypothetical protein QSJ18_10100 [Gordonia sp. ABSL1-1]|uniref:DUF6069 family protein n=1 Tax=Gordonia sp. ABSL1-1 TaxID=3053923 RepID=UPI002573E2DB|nr:DUF6069 family protein [Gordonia sp. ABSL1-1]MDL9937093.1 hypothetical protein [Gordonia sp. ABSL1-1]
MTYRDPRDPRTHRYEPGYDPDTRNQQYRDDQYRDDTYRDDPYRDDPRYRPSTQAYSQSYAREPEPPRPQPRYAATPDTRPRRRGPDINPGMYAGGVVMTGVVTGLAAWLAAWIIRAIVEQVNATGKYGIWNPVSRDEYWFAVVGFGCALAAGALWYVLQIITPSPDQFYRWIVGLLVAAAVVIPLILSDQVSVKIGTAVMHLIIGIPVLTLIPTMGHKSRNRR